MISFLKKLKEKFFRRPQWAIVFDETIQQYDLYFSVPLPEKKYKELSEEVNRLNQSLKGI